MKNEKLLKVLVFVVVVSGSVFLMRHSPSTQTKNNPSYLAQKNASRGMGPSKRQERSPSSISNVSNFSATRNEGITDDQKVEAVIKALSRQPVNRNTVKWGDNSGAFIDRVLRPIQLRGFEKTFKQSSRVYRTLPGVIAVPSDKVAETLPQDSKLLSFLDYTLVRSEEVEPNRDTLPVVYDPQRGTLGLVSGTLTVTYTRPFEIPPSFPQGLKLLQNFSRLGVATFISSNREMESLMRLVQEFRKNPYVKDISLEVVENKFVTK